jgi:hypothetical protein
MGFLTKLLKNLVGIKQKRDKNRKLSWKKKQTAMSDCSETLSKQTEEYPTMKCSPSSSSSSMTSSSSVYSVSNFFYDHEENKPIHVVDNSIPSNFEKKTSTPLNLKIEPLNRMTRRKSSPVLDVSGVQVYEDDTEKDDNHEDKEEEGGKVVTGWRMFVSNVNSDLYENTEFFKIF